MQCLLFPQLEVATDSINSETRYGNPIVKISILGSQFDRFFNTSAIITELT